MFSIFFILFLSLVTHNLFWSTCCSSPKTTFEIPDVMIRITIRIFGCQGRHHTPYLAARTVNCHRRAGGRCWTATNRLGEAFPTLIDDVTNDRWRRNRLPHSVNVVIAMVMKSCAVVKIFHISTDQRWTSSCIYAMQKYCLWQVTRMTTFWSGLRTLADRYISGSRLKSITFSEYD